MSAHIKAHSLKDSLKGELFTFNIFNKREFCWTAKELKVKTLSKNFFFILSVKHIINYLFVYVCWNKHFSQYFDISIFIPKHFVS